MWAVDLDLMMGTSALIFHDTRGRLSWQQFEI